MTPASIPLQAGSDDDLMLRLTPEQYERARSTALEELGMTYEQLADEAARRDFSSRRARTLWVMIGDVEE